MNVRNAVLEKTEQVLVGCLWGVVKVWSHSIAQGNPLTTCLL